MDYTMANMKPGQIGYVKNINCEKNLKRRLMDMGLIENTSVECVLVSPTGDPMAYRIRNTLIAIRNSDAEKIYIYAESEEM